MKRLHHCRCFGLFALLSFVTLSQSQAAWIWVEGENPAEQSMNRHPWYADVKTDNLSGGDFISNFNDDKLGEAVYRFEAPDAGEYVFWVHGNPVRTRLSYALNQGQFTEIDLSGEHREQLNIAADGKPDLRFVAWIRVGTVSLKKGANEVRFRMEGELSNHGLLDCFVLVNEPFEPQGTAKPNEVAERRQKMMEANKGWFAFDPPEDKFDPSSGFDLRFLNEKCAGEKGQIIVRDGRFVHSATGEPVRFWAINGPPDELKGDALRQCARMLAKRGVNLVRAHGAVFDGKTGEPNLARMEHLREIVEAMRAEGIYTHLSIYFPLWFTPKPGLPWLEGYDGSQHPFAALYFNPQFEAKYQEWWRLLLTGKGKTSGKALIDEPALVSVEIVNEDSYFFWTFAENNIPDPQLRILEKQFGDWLVKKHGSLDKALATWGGGRMKRDVPTEGRGAFRPLWNMFNEKTKRDQDTAAFLFESQTGFYRRNCEYLHSLGFKGLVTCSNWTTASAEVFGPLEKFSYTAGDFIDRHGYFGCFHKGDNAAWSIRDGHTYRDRSALRFDPEEAGKPKAFNHPVMDVHYNGRPSMISETAFTRPNRYRTEAPLFYSVYGALQGSDSIVHFALDGSRWDVKPRFWMQPWTLMSPTQMGQFPAAALIYRRGLVSEGEVLADIHLKLDDLLALKGTPLPQNAAFDELRLADVPKGTEVKPGDRIDPLIHFAGRTSVTIDERGGPSRIVPLESLIDRQAKRVRSSHGQVTLDYGRGLMAVNAPKAQAAVGALGAVPKITLANLEIESELELGAIVAVALDDEPLATSSRILLQVMSEEKANGFETSEQGDVKRIDSIGRNPWLVKEIQGTVRFKRSDAAGLKVTALDGNGGAIKAVGNAAEIGLLPDVVYYLITND
ncbi:MAG: hypothetical protein GXX96_29650 [Planctomycetaceae bacterium]|nr:hypothetical protein [Planctomycetaceae bacterium]